MIFNLGNKESNTIFLQLIGDHDLGHLDSEVEHIRKLSGTEDFYFVALKVDDWNRDLSPWEAPAVFGDESFGGGAEATLEKVRRFVQEEILDGRNLAKDDVSGNLADLNIYLGGYSLAGLFALWAAYKTDLFQGVVAASPSVWFPGFYEDISGKKILTERVYLSLGKKEERTRNPVMATVGERIRGIYELLSPEVECTLEWNEGNHFVDADLRTAKGFAWMTR